MNTLSPALLDETLEEIGGAAHRALSGGRDAIHARLSDAAGAPGNSDIRHVFDALRGRLAADWPAGCERFLQGFRERVADRSGTVGMHSAVNELQLIEDDVIEWDISIGNARARLAALAGEDLADLEQRLALLAEDDYEDRAGDHGMVAASMAAGVRAMVEAVAQTLTERRTLLFPLLSLLGEPLKAAVSAANASLAERGLNPAAARRAAAKSRAGRKREADVLSALERIAGPAPIGAGGGGAGGGGAGGGGAGGGGGGIPGGFVALPASVLDSLDRLQALDQRLLGGAADIEAPVGGSALRAFRQAEGRNLPAMEATMIDLVATIFDLIFQDGQVPDAIKALIGRLQIPLLKVAMSDRSFFSSREHPARAFLDAISHASVALGNDIDREHPFCAKVRTLINRVLEEFAANPRIFAVLLPELRTLIEAQEHEAQALAERSRRVAERQEQHELAEAKAEEVFERILKEGLDISLPPVAADFLGTHWPKVLKSAYLAGGQGGAQWTVALQTLTDLIWSLKPKDDSEQRSQLIRRLPGLLRRIDACLDRAEVKAEDRAPFMNCLMESHSALIKGTQKKPAKDQSAKPVPPPLRPAQPVTLVRQTVAENGIEVEAVSVEGQPKSARPIRSSEIGNVRVGDWVEFKRRGVWVRVRLSWVSPARGVMLFANPDNHKALSVTPEALALQLKSGEARVLEEGSLTDRVLEKAIDSLQAAKA